MACGTCNKNKNVNVGTMSLVGGTPSQLISPQVPVLRNPDGSPKYPGTYDVAMNGFNALKRFVKAGVIGKALYVSQAERDERLAVCNSCANFDTAARRCIACGCFIWAKAQLKTENCPFRLWQGDPSEDVELQNQKYPQMEIPEREPEPEPEPEKPQQTYEEMLAEHERIMAMTPAQKQAYAFQGRKSAWPRQGGNPNQNPSGAPVPSSGNDGKIIDV